MGPSGLCFCAHRLPWKPPLSKMAWSFRCSGSLHLQRCTRWHLDPSATAGNPNQSLTHLGSCRKVEPEFPLLRDVQTLSRNLEKATLPLAFSNHFVSSTIPLLSSTSSGTSISSDSLLSVKSKARESLLALPPSSPTT